VIGAPSGVVLYISKKQEIAPGAKALAVSVTGFHFVFAAWFWFR
jgi:hypothetical protein